MCVYDKRRVKEDEEDATRRKRTANEKKRQRKTKIGKKSRLSRVVLVFRRQTDSLRQQRQPTFLLFFHS